MLINNAGVISHPQEKTEDGFEINFQSNYLGKYNRKLYIQLQCRNVAAADCLFFFVRGIKKGGLGVISCRMEKP